MHAVGLLFFFLALLFVAWLIFGSAWKEPGRFTRTLPSSSALRASPIARMATRRAKYRGGPEYVNVTDLGLLAYRGMDEPRLVRLERVPLDTDYLRPFAELWLPHAARGIVRFEIRDVKGRVRYADESRYDLGAGYNTLLPGTWLPLREKPALTDAWEYRLLAGGMLLAAHRFRWQPSANALHRYIASDGEISDELQAALKSQAVPSMSLSELLAGQTNELPASRRQGW